MFTVGAATEALAALGDQMPEGVWLGTRYWYESHDSERNTKFVNDYRERYKTPPSYNAEGAYSAVYAVKAAIEKAGSAEPKDVAKALVGLTIDTPAAGERTFRVGDNQALVGPTWGRAGPMSADGIRSLTEIHNFKGADITPPVEKTGCTL